VSWGTKGSDKAEVLPSVSSKKPKEGDQAVIEDTARTREDLDHVFKDTVTRALTKVETVEEVEKPTMDDQNKTFRTRLVSFWMLSNAALAIAIENINGLVNTSDGDALEKAEKVLKTRQSQYFSVILWSTFLLAFVRFVGVRLSCPNIGLILIVCW
jgi:chitin synthase